MNENDNATPDPREINDDNSKNINLDKDTSASSGQTATPPPPKRDFEVEQEWAESLHINFDPEEARRRAAAPTPDMLPPQARCDSTLPPAPGQGFNHSHFSPSDNPGLPRVRPEPMPPTYLVWAIIATICCCIPAGIAAIIFSASVSSKYYAADYEGARKASERAQLWIIISIVAGIVSNALYLPVTLLFPS